MTQSTLTNLKKQVAPYEKSNTRDSIKQLINTIGPLFVLWIAAYLSLSISYWITLPITIIASGFVIRTFIIFHDCCHQSFFKSRRANEIIGTITGILTLFPYQQWKNSHSIHHATSSNLEKRGVGDMWVLTVDEYAASSIWVQIAYRLYRNPFIMFGLGPIFLFLFTNRFNTKGARRKERISTYMTNVSILALYGGLNWIIGWQSFVLIQAPIMFIAGLMGIWLFYVQHQFESSYFENEDEWSYVKAAVDGSSYYKLPKLLQWITGNIGFHHVHHLSPKVPNYNLEKAHNATPLLQKATTITIGTSLKSLSFRLWDEHNKTFVGYKNKNRVHRKVDEHDSLLNPIKVKVRKSSLQGQ
ncbi:fatty acid desaturase [Paenibacillus roseipurpureus]|uniref:Fatty acid desaturase n=1 Tax=Paenibacillus roseopurpureus TaxID=2918901 RepID=A0AA96LNQ3_9BACL|nr:fatty acid desaturase [Paenibacillus sp. MBLB1832]WNR45377.1 fatty acid desaturase [Paenibacillus sp. MBLB1832]